MLMDRDYRNILRSELVERCNRNPRYSLRAFSRDLKMDVAHLSEVLNGNKGISRAAALGVAKRLNWNTDETTLFSQLVESTHARSPKRRAEAKAQVDSHFEKMTPQTLGLDAFRTISEWYHLAILQLMRLPAFKQESKWIAKRLGIQERQAIEAIERLDRLELIEFRDGRYHPVDEYLLSPDGIPSDAIRKFHEQILQKASQALYTQPVEKRDFFTSLMPIAASDLPLIRKEIRSASEAIIKRFAHHPARDQVYSLSIQMINLTTDSQTDSQEKKV